MWEMDYESAANHWVEKDKESAHMEEAAFRGMRSLLCHFRLSGMILQK
ncbi:MAG: hypothetical protein J5802_00930 [Butyrivibrio sp.]|nr:hypothetical protein [Butyrivibrio sp.]